MTIFVFDACFVCFFFIQFFPLHYTKCSVNVPMDHTFAYLLAKMSIQLTQCVLSKETHSCLHSVAIFDFCKCPKSSQYSVFVLHC